ALIFLRVLYYTLLASPALCSCSNSSRRVVNLAKPTYEYKNTGLQFIFGHTVAADR
ncbi:hypothetical protein GOP47_0013944, partial [Adiantum capillus-veneris]